MDTRIAFRNITICVALACVNAVVFPMGLLSDTLDVDMNGKPTAVERGPWLSNVQQDKNGNDRVSILRFLPANERTGFELKGYVRKKGLKKNPDAWLATTSLTGFVGDEIKLSASKQGHRELIIAVRQNQVDWPLEYHRYSGGESLRDVELGKAEIAPVPAGIVGQWMCYFVSRDLSDSLIWSLTITNESSFELRMYAFDQVAVRDGWSLMLKLVGEAVLDKGILNGKRVYNVPDGKLTRWHGETPLLTKPVGMHYQKASDALVLVFPREGGADNAAMILTFHRDTRSGTGKDGSEGPLEDLGPIKKED